LLTSKPLRALCFFERPLKWPVRASAAKGNLGSHPDTAAGIKVFWPSVPNALTFRKIASSNKY
jgi:hypothetical protein